MNTEFDFNHLFVFDLANNHQGDVRHGLAIIREMGQVTRANGVRGALKFQFRQLNTFIHPSHKEGSNDSHIPRFISTRLSVNDYAVLAAEARNCGLVTMSTPFDEESVDVIEQLGIEVIKVASCSATDWPLLEKIAEANRPVIFSTGGLTLKEIDDVVSFFDHRRIHFAIMHCISIYPTPRDKQQLNQIEILRRRYPTKTIGFSTHEPPDDLIPVCVAVAKGARILERHVGLTTETIKLNTYSSTPAQVDAWIKAATAAQVASGAEERPPATPEETAALASLKRGVFARLPLQRGDPVTRDDVYFAMPWTEGQLASGDWKGGIVVGEDIAEDGALLLSKLQIPHYPDKQVLFTAVHTIKALLNEARIALNTEFEVEFSHHNGLANFPRVGATIINCINRDYCKKLVIQMPGQQHPAHYHKRKEETFQVLFGVLEMEVEGRRRTLHPGDIQLVQQGVWHSFWTDTGVIFEEVSTTHFNDDSFYEDKAINRMERHQRKTVVNNWGRYQI